MEPRSLVSTRPTPASVWQWQSQVAKRETVSPQDPQYLSAASLQEKPADRRLQIKGGRKVVYSANIKKKKEVLDTVTDFADKI